jgi:C1A family cysteine protease
MYGWLKDTPDKRDYRYSPPQVVKSLPPKVDLRQYFPRPYNQGNLNACTANAMAAAIEFDEIKQGVGRPFVPSRLFIYYNERAAEGTCLAGETKIRLLDGTSPTIQDLYDKNAHNFWVYGCEKRNRIVPSKANRVVFRGLKQTVKVLLDNGREIVCTPDHLFLARDGNYIQVKDLKKGQSLLPLYTKLSNPGYEQVFDPSYGRYIFTHRRVYKEIYENPPPLLVNAFPNTENYAVIHHNNFNKLDNTPTNLGSLNRADHMKLHREILRVSWNNPEKRALALTQMSEARKRLWREDESLAPKMRGIFRKNGMVLPRKINSRELKRGWADLATKARRSAGISAGELAKKNNVESSVFNHKVIAVIPHALLPVYDIEETNTHNFAIDVGVFVHNCNTDSGAQIRDGIKSVSKLGCCKEKIWPYLERKLTVRPTHRCYREAVKYKALVYQRLAHNLAHLKSCLASGFPFIFGIKVYSSFEGSRVRKTGHLEMPEKSEKLVGKHAVIAAGYEDSRRWFIVRNSWGERWGIGGYFTIPYEYLLDRRLSADIWTIRVIR